MIGHHVHKRLKKGNSLLSMRLNCWQTSVCFLPIAAKTLLQSLVPLFPVFVHITLKFLQFSQYILITGFSYVKVIN